jgi:cell division septum initiation protein DivIVA
LYSPRYEALLQRNRELDERNKELAEMINKAIEIQA